MDQSKKDLSNLSRNGIKFGEIYTVKNVLLIDKGKIYFTIEGKNGKFYIGIKKQLPTLGKISGARQSASDKMKGYDGLTKEQQSQVQGSIGLGEIVKSNQKENGSINLVSGDGDIESEQINLIFKSNEAQKLVTNKTKLLGIDLSDYSLKKENKGTRGYNRGGYNTSGTIYFYDYNKGEDPYHIILKGIKLENDVNVFKKDDEENRRGGDNEDYLKKLRFNDLVDGVKKTDAAIIKQKEKIAQDDSIEEQEIAYEAQRIDWTVPIYDFMDEETKKQIWVNESVLYSSKSRKVFFEAAGSDDDDSKDQIKYTVKFQKPAESHGVDALRMKIEGPSADSFSDNKLYISAQVRRDILKDISDITNELKAYKEYEEKIDKIITSEENNKDDDIFDVKKNEEDFDTFHKLLTSEIPNAFEEIYKKGYLGSGEEGGNILKEVAKTEFSKEMVDEGLTRIKEAYSIIIKKPEYKNLKQLGFTESLLNNVDSSGLYGSNIGEGLVSEGRKKKLNKKNIIVKTINENINKSENKEVFFEDMVKAILEDVTNVPSNVSSSPNASNIGIPPNLSNVSNIDDENNSDNLDENEIKVLLSEFIKEFSELVYVDGSENDKNVVSYKNYLDDEQIKDIVLKRIPEINKRLLEKTEELFFIGGKISDIKEKVKVKYPKELEYFYNNIFKDKQEYVFQGFERIVEFLKKGNTENDKLIEEIKNNNVISNEKMKQELIDKANNVKNNNIELMKFFGLVDENGEVIEKDKMEDKIKETFDNLKKQIDDYINKAQIKVQKEAEDCINNGNSPFVKMPYRIAYALIVNVLQKTKEKIKI